MAPRPRFDGRSANNQTLDSMLGKGQGSYAKQFKRTFAIFSQMTRAYAYNHHRPDGDKRSAKEMTNEVDVQEGELQRKLAVSDLHNLLLELNNADMRESDWRNAHDGLMNMLREVSEAHCNILNERFGRVETILGTGHDLTLSQPLPIRLHQLESAISYDIDSLELSKTRPLIHRIIEFEASVRELTLTFDATRKELGELKTTAAEDIKDKNELKAKLDQEQTKRFDVISEKANALREVEQLKKKSEEQDEELTSIDNNRKKISRNYQSSLESNSRLTAEKAELEGTITSLNSTLREAEMTCTMPGGLSEDVRPAERLSRLLDYQRRANSDSVHALQEQLDDACANSARLTTDLRATIRDQNYDIQDSARDAAEMNSRVQDQCGRMQVQTQTITDVQTALTKALLRKRKLRAEVRRLNSTNARVRSEVKKKNAQVRECKEKCDAEVTRLTESRRIALEEMAGLQQQSLKEIGIQHQTELDRLRSKHKQKVDEIQQGHQKELLTKDEESHSTIEALNKSHEAEVTAKNTAHSTAIQDLSQTYQNELAAKGTVHSTAMHDLTQAQKNKLEARDAAHSTAIQDLIQAHKSELIIKARAHSTAINDLTQAHREELMVKDTGHASAISDLTRTYKNELNAKDTAHSTSISDLTQAHTLDLNARDEETLSTVGTLAEQCQNELAAKDTTHEDAISAVKQQCQSELMDRYTAHENALAALKRRFQDDLIDKDATHENAINAVKRQSQNELIDKRAAHENAINALKQHHQEDLTAKDEDWFNVMEEYRRDDQIKLARQDDKIRKLIREHKSAIEARDEEHRLAIEANGDKHRDEYNAMVDGVMFREHELAQCLQQQFDRRLQNQESIHIDEVKDRAREQHRAQQQALNGEHEHAQSLLEQALSDADQECQLAICREQELSQRRLEESEYEQEERWQELYREYQGVMFEQRTELEGHQQQLREMSEQYDRDLQRERETNASGLGEARRHFEERLSATETRLQDVKRDHFNDRDWCKDRLSQSLKVIKELKGIVEQFRCRQDEMHTRSTGLEEDLKKADLRIRHREDDLRHLGEQITVLCGETRELGSCLTEKMKDLESRLHAANSTIQQQQQDFKRTCHDVCTTNRVMRDLVSGLTQQIDTLRSELARAHSRSSAGPTDVM